MKTVLKYKVIKDKIQYNSCCDTLHGLLTAGIDPAIQDEIDLLTLLIERYDEQQQSSGGHDPLILLRSFMDDHQLTPDRLASILNISDVHMSGILTQEKRMSNVLARKLSKHFKVMQEAFNTNNSLNKDQ